MRKIAKAISIARGCKSGKVATEKSTELLRDRSRRRMGTLIDCPTVDGPQYVESHGMTSLKAVPMFPAEESRVASGPWEKSLPKRDCWWKLEYGAEVRPYLTSKRTGKQEVPKRLGRGWTEMAGSPFWIKHLNAIPKGKNIQKEFVMGFPVARKEWPTPNALPDILRRGGQPRKSTGVPIQRLGNPIQRVQKTTCRRSSDRTNGCVSHLKVINYKTKGRGGKGRQRKRRRNKQLEEMVGNIVRWRAKTANCITDPNWGSISEVATNANLREQTQLACDWVVRENVDEPDSSRVPRGVGLGERESKCVV
jgi:hypothetical protein